MTTPLHITHNPGGNSGQQILCGAESNRTYRTLDEGTADRYVDRYFAEREMGDPDLCRDCLEVHDSMPAPTIPTILTLDDPSVLLTGRQD